MTSDGVSTLRAKLPVLCPPNIRKQFIPRKIDPLVFCEITEQVKFPELGDSRVRRIE